MIEKFLSYLPTIAKALAGTIAAFLVTRFAKEGLTLDETELTEIIGSLIVGLVVWVVKNRRTITKLSDNDCSYGD